MLILNGLMFFGRCIFLFSEFLCDWFYRRKKCWSSSYSVGDLLKLLDVSSAENLLLTTFGKLQPPLGKHRLKVN